MNLILAGDNRPPFFCFCIALFALTSRADGQEPAPPVEVRIAFEETGATPAVPQSLGDILKLCLLQSLEDEYVDEKHWGMTTDRFDGFRVKGLRISKRDREVNHGFWQRYSARIVHPEETLNVEVSQQKQANGLLEFTVVTTLRARCVATFAWWNWGVKGWNGTVDADATLQFVLGIQSQPQLRFSLTDPIPKLDLSPQVTRVTLKLKDIDLHRFGVLEGPVVKSLADGSRKAIEELLQGQERKIQTRLQAKLNELTTSHQVKPQ